MLLDQVALEMAKVLLPQMGEGYRTYEDLMHDAFTAAQCFIGTARQQPVESPENSPALPVQQLRPKLPTFEEMWKRIQVYPEWSAHLSSINRSMDCECFYDLICRQLRADA